MTKRFVIKNTPSKAPITFSLVLYLCMDKWNAPEWLWGVVGVIMIIIWIVILIDIYNDVRIDLFEDIDTTSPEATPQVKSRFQKRLEKMAKERKERESA